jgi:hypothetical protein
MQQFILGLEIGLHIGKIILIIIEELKKEVGQGW